MSGALYSYDFLRVNFPLSKSFIKQLHQILSSSMKISGSMYE